MPTSEPKSRKNDPETTKQDILAVATEEFAAYGLAGARVDAIAERTKTSKRMIYYYFGGKEDLYLAVLERSYRSIRVLESNLGLGKLSPVDALRRLIESTFEYDEKNPDFIRLVAGENINRAEHIRRSTLLRDVNTSIITTLTEVVRRGREDGSFKRDIDPIDLHMMISALCIFRVANRYTFGALFRRDMLDPTLTDTHRAMTCEMIIGYMTSEGGDAPLCLTGAA
ncbi:MAG: TetR/AcrR family transcriptional regulator [Neorhizobium sp.]|nr:TetR/AcrR family transcriptional regulator [Neorhizobium sp.]